MEKLLRFGRRKLHTITSFETIKPASPTPSHLQTYNLSLLDQGTQHVYMPLIFFYPNYNNSSSAPDKARALKKSLSQSLTQYYPFAGQFSTPVKTHVDCNDEGVLFYEAYNDSKLDCFLHKVEQDDSLDQFFPDGLVWLGTSHNKGGVTNSTSPVAVQLNHFACGGAAVAVSMSHRIADAPSLSMFMTYWATVTRCGSVDNEKVSSINPHFISFPRTDSFVPAGPMSIGNDCITRKFVFPKSKLSELKDKVVSLASGSSPAIQNPTRIEVLSSLLYKCAVGAKTTNSGCFNPSGLIFQVNMRNRMVEKLPETTVGNFYSSVVWQVRNMSELMPNIVVAEMKKGKKQLEGIRNAQEAGETHVKQLLQYGSGSTPVHPDALRNVFFSSSMCWSKLYEVDFGWGKPIEVNLRVRNSPSNNFVLMDPRDGDGIEAQATLEKEDMAVFQNDKELLAFCQKRGD